MNNYCDDTSCNRLICRRSARNKTEILTECTSGEISGAEWKRQRTKVASEWSSPHTEEPFLYSLIKQD
ncbi:hypothetical protein AB6A40_008406 [Gnathostoma spinigerum]|uniref:Uncharacterized protein n=1 Tax=Gnathostoma spinigerum TaxID=75299 RepID=A0ABD6EYL5_9BILA